MANTAFDIYELGGYAWECAVDNVLEIMNKASFRILTRKNDWALALSYAVQNKLRFDVNGNIV